MKACLFCAEEIQDEAIICRFCNRDQNGVIREPMKFGGGSTKRLFGFVIGAAVVGGGAWAAYAATTPSVRSACTHILNVVERESKATGGYTPVSDDVRGAVIDKCIVDVNQSFKVKAASGTGGSEGAILRCLKSVSSVDDLPRCQMVELAHDAKAFE